MKKIYKESNKLDVSLKEKSKISQMILKANIFEL